MPLSLYGPVKEAIQPGDLFAKVPFPFPTPEAEIFRPASDEDAALFRLYREGDLATMGGVRVLEKAAVDRRLVYAMLDPQTPPCQIDKMIPPPGRKPVPYSDDAVLTFFHCQPRGDISGIYAEKLKHPERHKRYALLGTVVTAEKELDLAVHFRRPQQLLAKQVERLIRIASPLDEVDGHDPIELILGAFDDYRMEGLAGAA